MINKHVLLYSNNLYLSVSCHVSIYWILFCFGVLCNTYIIVSFKSCTWIQKNLHVQKWNFWKENESKNEYFCANFSFKLPDWTFKKYFYALEVNDKSPMIIKKVIWHIIQIVTYIWKRYIFLNVCTLCTLSAFITISW